MIQMLPAVWGGNKNTVTGGQVVTKFVGVVTLVTGFISIRVKRQDWSILMANYDYTYQFPENFNKRVIQLLHQRGANDIISAFHRCEYEYRDVGNAYYAGYRGDNWNKNAVDFLFEGPHDDIVLMQKANKVMRDVIEVALMSNSSGYQLGKIDYLDKDIGDDVELPSSNTERLNADIQTAKTVLLDLITVSERICVNKKTYNSATPEDSTNDGIRDLLSMKGYDEVKDQTRHGLSLSGKSAGEVDILLCKDGKEIALIEALKLECLNTSYIDEHIKKAIINYNALGVATFIIAYVSVSDFGGFWEKYYAYLQKYSFTLAIKKTISEVPASNAAIREATMILSRDGYDFPVYFMALNI